jgi:ribosomal protein L11 methyltransferase
MELPNRKWVLLEISCRTKKQAQDLVHDFGGKTIKLPQNWLDKFSNQARDTFLRIGSRLVVFRSPHRSRSGSKVPNVRSIVIPAGAAFGTGEHSTTAMCLRLLERITRSWAPGWRMLDVGTGSGILAIAGSCFGAGKVFAIDSDPLACATARHNAETNGIRNLRISEGDALKHRYRGKFDLITANLFSEILSKALPTWSRHLTSGSRLILSGILRNQESTLVRALRRNGMTVLEIRRRGKWVALMARPRNQKGS